MRTKTALPLLALMLFLLQTSCTSTYYRGPVSDHFDGSRFHNPGKPDTKSRWDLLRWYWTRERGPWTEFSPLLTTDTPPARVEGETLRLSYVGHATVLIEVDGVRVLTDPILRSRIAHLRRRRSPLLAQWQNELGAFGENLSSVDILPP